MNQYDQQIQDTYQEGLNKCISDQYDQALSRFLRVQQLVPTFPFIDQNIKQCRAMEKAYINYLQAINLMNRQEWFQALYHLDFIQTRLQPSFKNTQQLIQDCTRNIWLLQLCINDVYVEQQNELMDEINNKMAKIDQIYGILLSAHNQTPFGDANEEAYLNERTEAQIQKLSIYFSCKREQKCLGSENNNAFKHVLCNTNAILNSNGMISCNNSDCRSYNITDAYFSCVTQKVGEKTTEINPQNNEYIDSLQSFADFIENCLQRNKLTDAEQQNFRLNLPTKLFPIFLRMN